MDAPISKLEHTLTGDGGLAHEDTWGQRSWILEKDVLLHS